MAKMALVERVTSLPSTGFDFVKRRWAVVKRLDPTESEDAVVLAGTRRKQTSEIRIQSAPDAHAVMIRGSSMFVVSSYRATVQQFNLRSKSLGGSHSFGGDVDQWHPNDLCEINGDVWASFFADPSQGASWKEDPAERGFLMNLHTGERLGKFTFLHSPTPRPEGIYVCDSGTSSLVLIDRQGVELRRRELSGFTRGLLVEDRYVVVGVSTHRLAAKASPGASESRLHVLDRATLKEIAVIDVPSTEIYQVGMASPWHVRQLRRLKVGSDVG